MPENHQSNTLVFLIFSWSSTHWCFFHFTSITRNGHILDLAVNRTTTFKIMNTNTLLWDTIFQLSTHLITYPLWQIPFDHTETSNLWTLPLSDLPLSPLVFISPHLGVSQWWPFWSLAHSLTLEVQSLLLSILTSSQHLPYVYLTPYLHTPSILKHFTLDIYDTSHFSEYPLYGFLLGFSLFLPHI